VSGGNATGPPFLEDYRASGILLHVTSLPSSCGIGDLGPVAASWIEQLAQAGQSWWQALPLGPTGYGNSPYQPLSSFAANPLVISADWLIEDELLKPGDTKHSPFTASAVDYERVIPFKHKLLQTAWESFKDGARPDLHPAYEQFCQDQDHWLADYALFRALKQQFDGVHYLKWPAELVRREPAAVDRMRRQLSNQVGEACFAQFLLFRQAQRLKAHAHNHGLRLIGDLPFFVSPDSSDVWANPELFLLDEELRPRFVAGVPPDYFSATGQLWGNPVYDWDGLRRSGYRWWIDRLAAILVHVDAVRLDHFRGFTAAWHVPADAATAQNGKWVAGPGADFWQAVEKRLVSLPFIAEDLGLITPEVYALRDEFHFPGMRVLQFAFDGQADNPYLPENYITNTVAYTGTHDNPTTRGWFDELTSGQRESIWKYLRTRGAKSAEVSRALMETAWSSIAALAMAPLQDLLNLGEEARMNVPGRSEGNWRWRCTEQMLSDPAFEWLRDITKDANRSKISCGVEAKTLEAASTSRGPLLPGSRTVRFSGNQRAS
jgi:4-alpha-glucanotransferase